MNKYIYMFIGALAVLIIAASVAIFNPALAQDSIYMPFFGGGDSGVDAAGSDTVEFDTESLVAKIEAGEIDVADTDLIPLTPMPAGREGPSKPSEQEIEELKEFAKNEPPKEEVVVYVSGPETKGQEVMWPRANSREMVQLPPDAWIAAHQPILCQGEPNCENGIAIAVMRDNSKLKLWTLNGRVWNQGLPPLDAVKKSQLRAEFPEIFAQLDAEVEGEIRRTVEEQGQEPVEIIVTAGPETKGQRTLVNGVGFVDLPADVWVDFSGIGLCSQESVKNGNCITGHVTIFKRDLASEALMFREGVPFFAKEQDSSKVREIFADVINLTEQAKSGEGSR